MGKRREARKPLTLPVRIFGTDRGGRIFSENANTAEVSQNGAKLAGVRAALKVDEIIGLTYGKSKVHFKVKWAGETGSPREGEIGLLNLTPEKPLWDFPLPSGAMDNFRFPDKDRRQSHRVTGARSAKLHPGGLAPVL